MKKNRYPVIHMGTVSILTILIILCMVIFAALSCISTSRDAAFTRQTADRTTAYYTASSEANRRIADIAAQLEQSLADGTWETQPDSYSFTVPIDEEKLLKVTLEPCRPQTAGDTCCRITEFTEIPAEEWESDATLPVLQPSTVP